MIVMLTRFLNLGFLLFLTALTIGATSTPAHAYLDPGTGSMILQVLLGGLAGIAVAGKFYWHRLRSLLGISSESAKTAASDDEVRSRSRAD
jgi:hypothetical protein